jgi:hypothetical protein
LYLYKKIVAKMARIIPAAAIKLPVRAVEGFDNIFKPMINVTEAIR